ncbi:MAG: helix-turn-helix domain-containing protein [Pseudonocardiaceae bacterium]
MARSARRQLAERLRELRESGLGTKLTQDKLATALAGSGSLSGAAISTWENGESDKRPSEKRIKQYALIFSSPGSLEPKLHVPVESTLGKSDRERFSALRRELFSLRDQAEQEARRDKTAGHVRVRDNEMWHHGRSAEMLVVTSELPRALQPPFARADHVNYTRLARYGHLDAFLEMYTTLASLGYEHLRHRSADDRGIGSAQNLVLVGGPSGNRMTRSFTHLLNLPVTQRMQPWGEPDVFVRADGTEVLPAVYDLPHDEQEVAQKEVDHKEVIEDVGLFVRAANPTNPDTDITICSGVYTFGVLGSVRAFTYPPVAPDNVDLIRSRVGRISDFYALFRVPVVNGRVPAPRLGAGIIECGSLD